MWWSIHCFVRVFAREIMTFGFFFFLWIPCCLSWLLEVAKSESAQIAELTILMSRIAET